MMLQCSKCQLHASIPPRLEGRAVECPRCSTVGYAGRRPGGLANLIPIDEPSESDAPLDAYLTNIEQELIESPDDELTGAESPDLDFYDLPDEPSYEALLHEAMQRVVNNVSLASSRPGNESREEWNCREANLAPEEAVLSTLESPDGSCFSAENTAFVQRRDCPRVDVGDLAVALETDAGQMAVENISASGIGLPPHGAHELQPGQRLRFRLVQHSGAAGSVPDELLQSLGTLIARVVRVDDGGTGMAYEGLDRASMRCLAGLIARLARLRNEAHIPLIQEAQGF